MTGSVPRDPELPEPFQLGEWTVEPSVNRVSRGSELVQVPPRVMEVLLCLAGAGAMWRGARSDGVGQQGEPREQEADHPALGQGEQRGTTRRRADPA